MKYIINVPEDKIKDGKLNLYAEVESLLPTRIQTGIKCEPHTEPDRKAIENEVWEFASVLMNMHPDVAEDIYWSMNGGKGIGVAAEMTYQEAKARYDAWQKQKDKIRVGDEVEYECGGDIVRFVVIGFCGETAFGVKYQCDYDDVGEFCDIEDLRKTGRHFYEIEELLKKMGEE